MRVGGGALGYQGWPPSMLVMDLGANSSPYKANRSLDQQAHKLRTPLCLGSGGLALGGERCPRPTRVGFGQIWGGTDLIWVGLGHAQGGLDMFDHMCCLAGFNQSWVGLGLGLGLSSATLRRRFPRFGAVLAISRYGSAEFGMSSSRALPNSSKIVCVCGL